METWTFGQIKIDGFQNEPQEGYIELTPDAGVPYRRERFSDIQDIVKGNFTVDKADYLRFMSWYKVNIKQGSIPFKFFDCRIKKERVARIVGKPTYTTNSKFYDISVTIAFDSDVFYSDDKLLVANPANGLVASVLNKYFDIVGSPVITDDGVVLDFKDGFLKCIKDTVLSNASTFSIEGDFVTSETSTITNQNIVGVEEVFKVRVDFNSINILFKTTKTAWAPLNYYAVSTNTKYYYRFSFTGTSYDFYIGNTKNALTRILTVQDDTKLITQNTPILLGKIRSDENTINSIDLKQFSITVDGVKVFDGSQIPYEGKLLIANTRYSL